jgi:phenylpropionate dioxygenase-like ring-hydroxylating dioxygenase large terminal subunit
MNRRMERVMSSEASEARRWLRNVWYQAGWSEEVTAEARLVRTILDEPILFHRDGERLFALLDRCPHRFAPLSEGRFGDGIVTCPYHGLAFDGTGACARNPHGPVTSAMRVRAYPVLERHSAIWVWMGDPQLADPNLLPNLSFIDETPPSARIRFHMPTKANYELLTDNILDLSHTDYIHPSSLGGIMTDAKARSWEEGASVVAEWISLDCEPPPAFKAMVPIGGADMWTEVRWYPPALMVLGTSAKPAGVPRTPQDEAYTLHNMTPETANSTHYFACATRRFLIEDQAFTEYLAAALKHAFEFEDKGMLEKQQARIGDADFWDLKPILLPVDAAAVRARRKLANLIANDDPAALQWPKTEAIEERQA